MTRAPVWAVVPVKPFESAKLRLASILDAGERAQLARLMFEDVLTVLEASRSELAGLLVVTSDGEAATLARGFGAAVITEAEPAGLNQAIALAVSSLAATPDAGLLVVPADLPHLTTDVVAQMVDLLHAPPAVALVEAPGDGGTNLLACRPAGVIPPQFGPQSFWLHRHAARHAGVRTRIVKPDRLGLDIDRPDDLAAFLSMNTRTRTHACLSELGIAARLADGQALSRGMISRAMVSI